MNKRMISGYKSHLSIILSLLYLCTAPVLQVLHVYAAEPAEVINVWEVMETQLVGANSIITDQAVVNAYASNLGSIAAEGATAEVINIGIQNAANQCGVDLGQVFANTAESAAAVGVNAAAASAGENIAASCAAVTAGGISAAVLPALGGIAVSAGTYYIVQGLKHIEYCISEIYKSNIQYGLAMKNGNLLLGFQTAQNIPNGSIVQVTHNGSIERLVYPAVVCQDGSQVRVYFLNSTDSAITGTIKVSYNNSYLYYNVNPFSTSQTDSMSIDYGWNASGPSYGTSSDLNQFINNLKNGTVQMPLSQSPDIASINGFQRYDPQYIPENNPDVIIPNLPELYPLPDYANDYGLAPIPEADYQNIVTYINNYPKPKTLEDQEKQGEDFPTVINPIIDPYLVPIGDPSPNPNPDPQPTGTPDPNPTGTPDPNPTGAPNPNPNPNPRPDTQPFPDPDTVPQPTPVVNPTPDSQVAPAPVPYPDPETPTDQDKTDTDKRITPIDLRDKFPFCIPFDIVKIMKLFQGGREAPCFTWEIPFGQAGSGSVTVDLSPWDSAATLLRTLELILFIMLLAVGTRNLIGGSG